jgi:hypothetical protein
MTTADRAEPALRQALKALNYALPYLQTDGHGNGPDCAPVLQAIIDLNAALYAGAAPVAPSVAEPELLRYRRDIDGDIIGYEVAPPVATQAAQPTCQAAPGDGHGYGVENCTCGTTPPSAEPAAREELTDADLTLAGTALFLAWEAGPLSEGQVASALKTDRLTCRIRCDDMIQRGLKVFEALRRAGGSK